jgi:hypothetical protein
VTRSRVDVAEVRRLVRLLPSYLDEGVYDATVSAPDGAGLQFFDDNEWLALDLVDAWHLLGDRSLLRRAERVFGWITSGWDGDSSTRAAAASTGRHGRDQGPQHRDDREMERCSRSSSTRRRESRST